MSAPLERYCRYLETLTPEALSRLGNHVTPDVRFKDPFNDVTGIDEMHAVFHDMFEKVPDLRFRVQRAMADDDKGLMTWRFEGRLLGQGWSVEGATALRFASDGRVAEHIDYWDAAANFYERLPFIGWLLTRLRRRIASH